MKGTVPHPEQTMEPLNRELQDYLDQLLCEVSVEREPPASEASAQPPAAKQLRPLEAHRNEAAQPRPWAEPRLRIAPRLPSVASPAIKPEPEPDLQAVVAPSRPVDAAGPPRQPAQVGGAAAVAAPAVQSAWRDAAFEALLFRAGGLTLAVPLTLLGAIRPLEETPTALFGQAPWFMGMLSDKEGTLRIVDTAQVIMAERYRPEMRAAYRYVISLHGSDWALAVDEIGDAVTLQPSDIRWRSPSGKRPWLAGTVVERMCALLDVRGLDTVLGRG